MSGTTGTRLFAQDAKRLGWPTCPRRNRPEPVYRQRLYGLSPEGEVCGNLATKRDADGTFTCSYHHDAARARAGKLARRNGKAYRKVARQVRIALAAQFPDQVIPPWGKGAKERRRRKCI